MLKIKKKVFCIFLINFKETFDSFDDVKQVIFDESFLELCSKNKLFSIKNNFTACLFFYEFSIFSKMCFFVFFFFNIHDVCKFNIHLLQHILHICGIMIPDLFNVQSFTGILLLIRLRLLYINLSYCVLHYKFNQSFLFHVV